MGLSGLLHMDVGSESKQLHITYIHASYVCTVSLLDNE